VSRPKIQPLFDGTACLDKFRRFGRTTPKTKYRTSAFQEKAVAHNQYQHPNIRLSRKCMKTKTIGIIQVKGGAGRSTVSTNLAGELYKGSSQETEKIVR
jgi:Mrp family chromosome partitioning ATPase